MSLFKSSFRFSSVPVVTVAVVMLSLLSSRTLHADTFYLTATPQFAGGYTGTGTVTTFGSVSATGTTVAYSSSGSTSSGGAGGGGPFNLICNPQQACTIAGQSVLTFRFDITFSDGTNTYEFDNQDLTDDASLTFMNGNLTGGSIKATDVNGKNLKIGGNLAFEIYGNQMASYGRLSSSLTAPASVDPVSPGASTVTPEPSSLLLLATGLVGTATTARRRLFRA